MTTTTITTTTAAAELAELRKRLQRLPLDDRLGIEVLCARRAHDALRSAVSAEPIRALRVCSARAGSCPWPYWDYVRVDIVPAKSRRGAATRVVGGGACRRYRSQDKARREGTERYPNRLWLGYGAGHSLERYPAVLGLVEVLLRRDPEYVERHPELLGIVDDLRSALELNEL